MKVILGYIIDDEKIARDIFKRNGCGTQNHEGIPKYEEMYDKYKLR